MERLLNVRGVGQELDSTHAERQHQFNWMGPMGDFLRESHRIGYSVMTLYNLRQNCIQSISRTYSSVAIRLVKFRQF